MPRSLRDATPNWSAELHPSLFIRSEHLIVWSRLRAPGRILLGLLVAAGVFGLGDAASADATPWVPESAIGETGVHAGEPRLEARLLIDAGRSTFERARIGVLFDLDPGWHIYWRNSGDTGLPTELDIRVPGASVGPIEWPAPRAFSEADGAFVTYGYEDRVLLMTDVTLDPDYTGAREITVDADVLICKNECIPADVSIRRSLDEALIDSPDNQATTAFFESFEARLPVSAASLGLEIEGLYSQSAVRPGDHFEAALLVRSCVAPSADGQPCTRFHPAADGAAFFPASDSPVLLRERGPVASESDPAVSLLGLIGEVEDGTDKAPARLTGVLALTSPEGGVAHVEVDVPLPFADAGAEVSQLGAHWIAAESPVAASSLGIVHAILLALLGGLILNLMPCVLPVLAIKVFAVAEMGGRSRRALMANGAAYALGILASMGVLAGFVLTLRGIGTEVGWGFQFQSPIFIAMIAVVLVAFAMNLFGVYEINVDVGRAAQLGAATHGNRRSFFEGLLAVVLATPCSAPFLGTAVGFAFASSPVVIVAIFLAIGAGLALPFVLITLVPGFSRFVPRPGAWMLRLRTALGFALLATVIWLLWLTGGVAGVDGLISLLVLLLTLAFGLFLYGGLQQSERRWLRIATGLSLVAITLFGLDLVRADLASGGAPAAETSHGNWQPWEPSAIDEALSQGDSVLVVFSADWCITCKVNERVVLQNPRVVAELDRLGVRIFKADWTRRDETIRAELARHGRAGVPLYLVYDPERPHEPVILPEILSVGDLVESLRAASTTRADRAS